MRAASDRGYTVFKLGTSDGGSLGRSLKDN